VRNRYRCSVMTDNKKKKRATKGRVKEREEEENAARREKRKSGARSEGIVPEIDLQVGSLEKGTIASSEKKVKRKAGEEKTWPRWNIKGDADPRERKRKEKEK